MFTQVIRSEIDTDDEPSQSPTHGTGVGVIVGVALRERTAVRVAVLVRTGGGVRLGPTVIVWVGVNVLTGLQGTTDASSIRLAGGSTLAPGRIAGRYSGPG
jgi:hypothetical protein